MDWTPEQEKAIGFRGGAAIVSAAAGSGKTAVLVERVKRMILDGCDPVNADEMVIATFTNKAADEMKARLERAIEEEISKDPGNRRLIEQRLRLNDASISTINSFCLDLLRRNSACAGLPPDISVLDESEAELMLSQALTSVMEEFCESGDHEKRDLLYDWFMGRDDSAIVDAVRYLYSFSRNIPDAAAYFDTQLEAYRDPDRLSEKQKNILSSFININIRRISDRVSGICDSLSSLSQEPQAAAFAAEWRSLSEKASSIFSGNNIGISRLTNVYEENLKGVQIPSVPRKTKNFDNTALKEYQKELKELWEQLVRAAGMAARRTENMSVCAPVLEILISLVRSLDRKYSSAKLEKGRVDFSDIELLTLRMLRGENGEPSDIAAGIAKNIRYIIVDEFQDSNEVQYEIFRLISDNKKNLYFVGDIKQSIYRFRGADPLVFSRLTKDPDFTVIDLNRNFRSCKEVIDSANGIFMGTMTEELGDVNYDESCALVQGAKYDTDEKNRTELLTFTGKQITDARKYEAAYIADRIREMVRCGFTVGAGDDIRPCNYGDFAVLMGRYSSHISVYKAALDSAGIPYKAKEDGDYTDFEEVRHALALLRVIDDPYRDTDLAAVLMKEPFMLSADEMAQIKLAGGVRRDNLWTGLNEFAKENKKAAAVLSEIREYREFAAENSPERLIRKICDESLLIPAAEARPDGAKRGADLRMLIHYAEQFSGGESASLYDFIRYIEKLDSEKINLPQAKGDSGGGNYVRLMTIHGSKGLEFPICFVANVTGSKPAESGMNIICDPNYGIGMKIRDSKNMLTVDTFMYDLVSGENTRLELSERMRLLYVAATRAKEKLIFTVPTGSRSAGNIYYDWIINSAAVLDGLIDVRNYGEYISTEIADEGISDERVVEIPPFSEYAYSRFSKLPAKVTATQIGVKSVDDFAEYGDKIDRFLRVPSFIGTKETSRLTGKKRGDAYHKVMELLDFNADPEEVPQILDELRVRGKISDIERSSVDEDDIARFLQSDVCRRAAASGDINREFPIFCEYTPTPEESGISDWTGEEKPFIQGIADMFFVEDGEIVLVDYKTNTRASAEMLIDEYRGQLEIYARALSESTGMKIRQKLLYSFELGEISVD